MRSILRTTWSAAVTATLASGALASAAESAAPREFGKIRVGSAAPSPVAEPVVKKPTGEKPAAAADESHEDCHCGASGDKTCKHSEPDCNCPRCRRLFPLHRPWGVSLFEPSADPHVGLGDPLERGSWLNRPYSLGLLGGGLVGNTLASGVTEQEAAPLLGFRAGWDVGDYWGLEARFAFADPHLHDIATEVDLDRGDNVFWDVNVLCYPWGESRLRPYGSIGLGMAKYDFSDIAGRQYSDDTVALPIGVGLKYRCSSKAAVRFDLTDTIAINGHSVGTLQNLSFTFGVEWRFGGGSKTTYWPWDVDHTW